MGGKKTTNVTNQTGLGDQQFADLSGGQDTLIRGQTTLGENQVQLGLGIDNLNTDMNTGFTTLGQNNANNTQSILEGQQGVQDYLNTQTENFTNQMNLANEARAAAQAQAQAAAQAAASAAQAQASALAGLKGTTETGFANTKSALDQGFANNEERFQQAAQARLDFQNASNDDRQRIFELLDLGQIEGKQATLDARAALMQGQSGIRDNLSATEAALLERSQAAQDYLENVATTNQAANLEQQMAIQDLLNTYGGNLDAYYQDLAASNAASAERQGELQTGLDTFRSDQAQANTLGQQQQAQLLDTVLSGTDSLTNTIAGVGDTLVSGQEGLMSQSEAARNALTDDIADVMSNQAASEQLNNMNFAQVSQLVTSGFESDDPQYQAMKQEFTDRMDFMQKIVSDQNLDISDDLRNTFNTMVSSFDEQGALISQTQVGNDVIRRAIDDQGDLFLTRFNQYGDRIAQGNMNINVLMGRLNELGYVPGSSQNMANTSGTALPPSAAFGSSTNPAAQTTG